MSPYGLRNFFVPQGRSGIASDFSPWLIPGLKPKAIRVHPTGVKSLCFYVRAVGSLFWTTWSEAGRVEQVGLWKEVCQPCRLHQPPIRVRVR